MIRILEARRNYMHIAVTIPIGFHSAIETMFTPFIKLCIILLSLQSREWLQRRLIKYSAIRRAAKISDDI